MRKLLAAILLVLSGCTHGFDRGLLKQSIATAPVVTDGEIAEVLTRKPQLRFPIKLGVLLGDPPPVFGGSLWSWTEADRTKILEWFEPLKSRGIVKEVVLVTDEGGTALDLKRARLAAARYGADALLIVRGIGEAQRYPNSLVVIDILTLTLSGFFNPSNHLDALFIIRATLWDVRNEYLYLEAVAEGLDQTLAPLYWNIGRDRDSLRDAQDEALKALQPELLKRMETLH